MLLGERPQSVAFLGQISGLQNDQARDWQLDKTFEDKVFVNGIVRIEMVENTLEGSPITL
jgi:hypothetical protein